MFDLYQEQILERYKQPQFAGELPEATHRGDGANYSCGDEVHWDVVVAGGVVKKIAHHTRACAICTASADLLAEKVINQPLTTIEAFTSKNIKELLGIPLSPTRLKCALLPLESLQQVFRA